MIKLQGLIFDLEGTLVDGAVDARHALNVLLAEHGREPLSLEHVKRIITNGFMHMIQRAFEQSGGLAGDDVFPLTQKFIHIYRDLKADPAQIYPSVAPMLDTYFKAGVKLGICTNMAEGPALKALRELGLDPYFEFVAGGDTFPVHKPNPEHLKGVITALDVPYEACVFVGDGINDVRAARGANVPCIVVTHSQSVDPETSQRADAIIASFDALHETLERLGFDLA